MKSFNEIYEEIYNKNHEELENLRKSRARRTAILLAVTLIGVFIIMKVAMSSMNSFIFFPWIVVISMMLVIIITATNKGKYTTIFKQKVIEPFVKNIDEGLNYTSQNGIDSGVYRQGEFEHFDRYHSEDLVIGSRENNTKFFMAEIQVGLKEIRNYKFLFKGLFAKLEIENKINSKVYIRKDSKNIKNPMNIEQIELDSQGFENLFNVYSDNKIVTMQILTSDIMNMLIDFYKEIPFEVTIKNNNIYIRFYTGDEDMFETPLLDKEALDKNTLYKYYSILDFTFELINKLQEVLNKAKI